jgi:para-aminobenzoate synthetase component 1
MEIIEELEPVRRGFYTGSLGYLADNGDLDLNVAIRTLVISGQRALFHVGAGIVWDSTPNLEYSETLHKGRSLFELLGGSPHTATLDPDTADRLAACSPEERPACE